jgi:hypothetical protein
LREFLTEVEIAYFAGIIDGEGCFSLRPQVGLGDAVYVAALSVGNTDARLMQWIHQRFGGSLQLESRSNPKHQPVWRWVASSTDIDQILQRVLPYLVVKQRQAELFVAYRATLNTVATSKRARGISHSTARVSDAVKATRRSICAELSALKRPHLKAASGE